MKSLTLDVAVSVKTKQEAMVAAERVKGVKDVADGYADY